MSTRCIASMKSFRNGRLQNQNRSANYCATIIVIATLCWLIGSQTARAQQTFLQNQGTTRSGAVPWNTGTDWDNVTSPYQTGDGIAPNVTLTSASNDMNQDYYIDTQYLFRTPNNNNDSSGQFNGTFGGLALELIDSEYFANNAGLSDAGPYNGSNSAFGGPETINNLILNGSDYNNPNQTSFPSFQLNGTISLGKSGATFWHRSFGGGSPDIINSNISGSGGLRLGGNDSGAAGAASFYMLSGTNNYTGETALLGGVTKLLGPGALPVGANLRFGSGFAVGTTPSYAPSTTPGNTAASGQGTLDLNGGSYTIGGLNLSNFTTSATAVGTSVAFVNQTNNAGTDAHLFHFSSLPAGLQVGQAVTYNNGTNGTVIVDIDYTTGNIRFGDDATSMPFQGSGGSYDPPTPITFKFIGNSTVNPPNGALPTSANQTITNTSASNSTLTFAGTVTSTFGGVIQNGTAGGTTALTVSGGSLTLNGANTYTGNTTVSGGTLALDFSTAAAATTSIVNTASALKLSGGTLSITSASSGAKTQAFAGTTVNGSSNIQLNTNTTGTIAANLGAITRTAGGTLNVVNPSGTLSATNGVLITTSLAPGSLLVDANNVPFATAGSNDWAKTASDGTNNWIVPLAAADYTAVSGATTFSVANADVISNASGGGTANTLRFSSTFSRTLSGSSLTTRAILVTTAAGAGGTINTASLNEGLAGQDLVIINNNASGILKIGTTVATNISNNGGSGLTKAGVGTVELAAAAVSNYAGATHVTGGTLQIDARSGLYNATPASWTAGNIIVNNGATLALTLGGTGFTSADVATIAALGDTSGNGFQNGSTLSLINASAFAMTNPIVTSATNTVGLTKAGAGTLTVTGANTYTGPTTVSAGTLQLGAGASLVGTSGLVVNGGTFDLNGNSTSVATLSGSGGSVTIGAANFTIGAVASGTFSGAITGSGNLTIGGLASAGQLLPTTGGGTIALNGTSSYTGSTTITNSTLNLSSSSSSTVGSPTSTITVAPNPFNDGTLGIGSGMTVVASSVALAPGANSYGTLNVTGGALKVVSNGNINVGNSSYTTASINQTGGSVTFYSDTGTTTGGTGALNFNGVG